MTNDTRVNDDRIADHLDTIDADPERDALIAALQSVAAERGFTVEIGVLHGSDYIDINSRPSSTSYAGMAVSGPKITTEVLTDLITFFQNAEDPEYAMNIYSTDLFKYLSGDMIGQSQITLTITSVTQEKMNSGRGGEQLKPCLHFQERNKTMVLNKTNAAAIAKELGPETDNWVGGRVTLNAPVIDAFGKQSRSIRVIRVDPPDVPAKPRGNGNGNGNGNTATPPPPSDPTEQGDLFTNQPVEAGQGQS